MPIYEYRCRHCGREFSVLWLKSDESKNVRCKFCQSRNIARIVSPFSYHQSEQSRLESFETSKPQSESFYRDSRNVGLWTKKRMKELGVDLGPKLDEIVERGRTGKILEEFDKS